MTDFVAHKPGWAWPAEARKEHFFRRGRSLCGKWGWLRSNDYLLSERPTGPLCITCQRKASK